MQNYIAIKELTEQSKPGLPTLQHPFWYIAPMPPTFFKRENNQWARRKNACSKGGLVCLLEGDLHQHSVSWVWSYLPCYLCKMMWPECFTCVHVVLSAHSSIISKTALPRTGATCPPASVSWFPGKETPWSRRSRVISCSSQGWCHQPRNWLALLPVSPNSLCSSHTGLVLAHWMCQASFLFATRAASCVFSSVSSVCPNSTCSMEPSMTFWKPYSVCQHITDITYLLSM